MFELEESLDSLVYEYKSRNKKCKKYKTNHSLKRVPTNDLHNHNSTTFVQIRNTLPSGNIYEQNGLTLEDRKMYSNTDIMVRNRPTEIRYSLNKKKRWLLPDLLKQTAQEYRFKKEDKNKKQAQDDELTVPHGLNVSFHYSHNSLNFWNSRKTMVLSRYFNNNGLFLDQRVNQNSLLNRVNNLHARTLFPNERNAKKVMPH